MERTKETLKELIRAGRAKVPAHKVIKGGQLVNVMSSEIYPADVAVYNDMIVAVGDVEDYIGSETEIIDATGYYLTPGMIDGHIHSECSKMSITSYAKAVVPRGTTSMISGLDEYISVSGLEGLQEVLAEMKQSPLKVFWVLLIRHHTRSRNQPLHLTSQKKFTKKYRNGRSAMEYGKRYVSSCRRKMKIHLEQS